MKKKKVNDIINIQSCIINIEGGDLQIKIIKTLVSVILNIIIFLEIIFIIIFLGPNLFGIKTFVVTSGSMEPLYPTGSLIFVEKVNADEIKVDDVITFYMKDSSIIATHQVYEIDEINKEFGTQGINNKDEKGNIIHDATRVKFSDVIGKPILCINYLGYINRLIATPPGIYIVFMVMSIMILIYYILEKKMEEK